MALLNMTDSVLTNISPGLFSEEIIHNFSFSDYLVAILPLLLFILGVFIYALFIFKFYRLLARKDILQLDLHKYSHNFSGYLKHIAYVLLYAVENILLIPLLVIVWVIVLTLFLTLLSKTHSPELVLLTSVAIVAAVRISAYYNENLSQDLAKMIPFALLGVFLVDMSFFSLETSIETAKAIPLMWVRLIYYLVFVMILELIMRIVSSLVSVFRSTESKGE